MVEGALNPRQDCFGHTFHIAKHFGRRNSEQPVAFACQISVTALITSGPFASTMRLAIDLDHQPAFTYVKIDHIGADWMLVAYTES